MCFISKVTTLRFVLLTRLNFTCYFTALECGLPLLNPYKDQNGNFTHGANFAVTGATALPTEILTDKKINYNSLITNSSLNVQLDWMFSHFKSTCSTGNYI